MKKKILFITSFLSSIFLLTSCSLLNMNSNTRTSTITPSNTGNNTPLIDKSTNIDNSTKNDVSTSINTIRTSDKLINPTITTVEPNTQSSTTVDNFIKIDLDGGNTSYMNLNITDISIDKLPLDVKKEGFKFIGYSLDNVKVIDEFGTIINNANINNGSTLKAIYEEVDLNTDQNIIREGNYIYFGSYPNRKVDDTDLNNKLKIKSGMLPTSSNKSNWVKMNHTNQNNQNYYYQDIDYDSDGNYDYRGIITTIYELEHYEGNEKEIFNYGLSWYEYELLEWKILKEDNGVLQIISSLIIDASDYYYLSTRPTDKFEHNGKEGYGNNYELSNVRNYINSVVYDTAFNEYQKELVLTTEVDNSPESYLASSDNIYLSENTFDKMQLLSAKEGLEFFKTSSDGYTSYTDYSLKMGLSENNYRLKKGSQSWWLRSPYGNKPNEVYCKGPEGNNAITFLYNYLGVRPVCFVNTVEDSNTNPDVPEDNIIEFGSYPQTLVENEELIKSLNNIAGELPETDKYRTVVYDMHNWIDYEYYFSGEVKTFMFYQDIDYDSDGDYDYRGIYSLHLRPRNVYGDSESSERFYTGTIYWFKYEPVEWNILEEKDGMAFVVSKLALDAQNFNDSNNETKYTHNGNEGYTNNYELSTIRLWLNDNFYNTAFSDIEKELILTTLVDNSINSTDYNSNEYICNNTNDKIFLLSLNEVLKYFNVGNVPIYSSYYALSQGLFANMTDSFNAGCVSWWLRTPGVSSIGVITILQDYTQDMEAYVISYGGIRPAMWIKINN